MARGDVSPRVERCFCWKEFRSRGVQKGITAVCRAGKRVAGESRGKMDLLFRGCSAKGASVQLGREQLLRARILREEPPCNPKYMYKPSQEKRGMKERSTRRPAIRYRSLSPARTSSPSPAPQQTSKYACESPEALPGALRHRYEQGTDRRRRALSVSPLHLDVSPTTAAWSLLRWSSLHWG